MTREARLSTHSDGDAIACPWCGERQSDLWEYGTAREEVETECGTCGEPFTLRIHVSVTYTATRPA